MGEARQNGQGSYVRSHHSEDSVTRVVCPPASWTFAARQLSVGGGPVWRRNFQFGDVYVNSDERKTVSVLFAGAMRRLSGQLVSRIDLPPHTGAVLLYTSAPPTKAPTGTPRSSAVKRGGRRR